LFAGDLIALILFVVVGQRDHELVNEQNPVSGVLLSTLYFAAPIGVLICSYALGRAVIPDGSLYVSDDKGGFIYRISYTGK